MAGWVHPAMDGPAGQERGQGAADGAVVAEDVQGLVQGDGPPEGGLVALEGDPERRHARHSGFVRCLGRVLENEATVGRGFRSTTPWRCCGQAPFSGNRRSGRDGCQVGDRARWTGSVGHRD